MHRFAVMILSSGSIGNSALVMSEGKGLLIDAGIGCREIERRMSFFGVDPTQVEVVLLTHEHTDHVRGARRFALDRGVPVLATRGTLALTPLEGVETRQIAAGKELTFGSIRLEPFKVRHLAAEPVAFTVADGSGRVSIATDLGSVTSDVVRHMSGADLLFVEANYDEKMLLSGSYPEFLKRAIKGDHGHLSNEDAAHLSESAATERTKKVVLVHLSKENNTPETALRAVTKRLGKRRSGISVEATEHGGMSGPFVLA